MFILTMFILTNVYSFLFILYSLFILYVFYVFFGFKKVVILELVFASESIWIAVILVVLVCHSDVLCVFSV